MEEDKEKVEKEIREKMEHLLVISSQRLKELQRLKAEKKERLERLVEANAEKSKRWFRLQQRLDVAKGKSAQLKPELSKLEEEEKTLAQALDVNKMTRQEKDKERYELGMKGLSLVHQGAARIAERKKEVKSTECLKNGKSTKLCRMQELKKEVEATTEEIELNKAKLAEIRKSGN